MSELQALVADIMHYIQQDLSAFEEDYKASPENSQSLTILRFMKHEFEEMWPRVATMTLKYPIR